MRKKLCITLVWIVATQFVGLIPAYAAAIDVIEVIPPQYDLVLSGWLPSEELGEVSEGIVGVGIESDLGTKWGFVNCTGEVVPPKYDSVSFFSEGMAAVGVGKWENYGYFSHFYGEYGYINSLGEEVISPQYDKGSDFHEGVAVVKRDGEYLVIDSTGKEQLTLAQYDSVQEFHNGFARVELNEKWGFIDREGKEVIPPKYSLTGTFDHGVVVVGNGTWEDGYTYGYVNKEGEEFVPVGTYSDASGQFFDDLAWVNTGGQFTRGCVIGGKYGFIDTSGKEVIPLKYDEVRNFSDGVAVVRQGNNWSIIDTTGKKLVSLGSKYSYVSGFSDGLACVRKGNAPVWRYGFIDKTGKEVIPVQYETGSEFHEGLAAIMVDGKYGYIDKNGTVVVPFQYDIACDFCEGIARIINGGKSGFLAIIDPSTTAFEVHQTMLVDNQRIEFDTYALKDANGNLTNYIKLRDIASLLNGTAAQFDVSWDGAVNILSGQAYTPNGSEMTTPFSGDRAYTFATAPTKVNGKEIAMDAIVLKDDQGGAYTYYKLRDLGEALGFTVDWSAQRGIYIETQ